MVDAFVYESVLVWKDKKHQEIIEYLKREPKKKRRKLGLEELRARNVEEFSLKEAKKVPGEIQEKDLNEIE
jgi:hypothetical protein